MWWASFGLACQLSLYPFTPKEPECWVDMSTTYDVEIIDDRSYGSSYYLPGATETLLGKRKNDKKSKNHDQ